MRLEIAVIAFIALLIILLYILYLRQSVEKFTDVQATDNQRTKDIVHTYKELLNRLPSQVELDRIEDRKMTVSDLEDLLLNSDEYARNAKVETDAPQLDLMQIHSEKFIMGHIAAIYKSVKGITVPPPVILPLKDMYVYFAHNDEQFRNFLSAGLYDSWEVDVMENLESSWPKATSVQIYKRYFEADADQSAAIPQVRLSSDSFTPNATDGHPILWTSSKDDTETAGTDAWRQSAHAAAAANLSRPIAMNTHHINAGHAGSLAQPKMVFERPTVLIINNAQDAQQALSYLGMSSSSSVMSQPAAATADTDSSNTAAQIDAIATQGSNTPIKKLYFDQQKDMVLRPEFEWSVPQQRAPVCTPLPGMKATVQATLDQTALIGTPLQDASNNQIMPNFEFKQILSS